MAAMASSDTPMARSVSVLHLPGGRCWYTTLPPDISRLIGYEEGIIRGIRLNIK